CPSYENIPPEVNIITKGRTKAGSPLKLRADITDDVLGDNFQIQWTSENEEIEFTEPNSLLSKVISWVPGTYPVSCTVSDGEHMVSVSTLITVEKSDIYDQIGAEDGIEAPAPEILVTIPEYADRQQIIDAHIENLNDTEIAWYSVILNGNQVIPVDNDGNFTITMPNRDGKYSVDIRAFDWSGKSDQKLYYITVDSAVPTVNV